MNIASFEQRGGIMHVQVEAERLDAVAAPAFKTALEQQLSGKPDRAIVDVRKVVFLDSTGLGVLVAMLKMMDQPGVLAIAGAGPAVRRLLQITQLDQVFRLFDSPEQAQAALGG
jgi:anti-sigma B factor antagonist